MRIAIVQDGPVYLDAEQTLVKTLDLISDAAAVKANLIVFGENWFSGYPVWLDICQDVGLWDYNPVKEIWAKTFRNGISAHHPIMKTLQKAIADADIYVVMGVNEPIASGPHNGTIFNSIFTFDPQGNIINLHRKLVPTFTEKLVHGPGDGAGLKALETPFGRLGSLICWEHWMPLTRQAMHDEAEDIHIALWPYAKELHQVASRHYAHEGRCHVVAVGQVMHIEELPSNLNVSEMIDIPEDGYILSGGCAIYGPDGSILKSPEYGTRKLIIEELDVSKNLGERMNLAVSGHYQRHDIFDFKVNKIRKL